MKPLLVFGVLLASYAINAMDRQIFPLIAPDVRREYGFSLEAVGFLTTVFTLGMALAGVATSYLLARVSRKTVLQIGIAVFSAGTALTVLSSGFADMLVYRQPADCSSARTRAGGCRWSSTASPALARWRSSPSP